MRLEESHFYQTSCNSSANICCQNQGHKNTPQEQILFMGPRYLQRSDSNKVHPQDCSENRSEGQKWNPELVPRSLLSTPGNKPSVCPAEGLALASSEPVFCSYCT